MGAPPCAFAKKDAHGEPYVEGPGQTTKAHLQLMETNIYAKINYI